MSILSERVQPFDRDCSSLGRGRRGCRRRAFDKHQKHRVFFTVFHSVHEPFFGSSIGKREKIVVCLRKTDLVSRHVFICYSTKTLARTTSESRRTDSVKDCRERWKLRLIARKNTDDDPFISLGCFPSLSTFRLNRNRTCSFIFYEFDNFSNSLLLYFFTVIRRNAIVLKIHINQILF